MENKEAIPSRTEHRMRSKEGKKARGIGGVEFAGVTACSFPVLCCPLLLAHFESQLAPSRK